MRKDFASLIAIISIFSLVACTDGKPEFFSLSSVMGPTFSGESAKEYSIAEMTDSLLISGECPPQMSQIEISLDQGNTWELPGDDSSDLDCLDQKFSFEIKDAGSYLGFTDGLAETRSFLIRGVILQGQTTSGKISVVYQLTSYSLLATLTGAPQGNDSSTNLNISVGGVDIISYKYKVGTSVSVDCADPSGYGIELPVISNITDSIAQLPDGLIKLCVLGSDGIAWQNELSATEATWTKESLFPAVTRVTSSNVDGLYGAGDHISIVVLFSDVVVVTGAPMLKLDTGDAVATASYSSGSGTNQLSFSYTVGLGEFSNDLDYLDSLALYLNGGTILGTGGSGASAILDLPAPGSQESLSTNKNIQINSMPAVLSMGTGNAFDYGSLALGSTRDHTFSITHSTGALSATNMSGMTLSPPFSFVGGSYPGIGGSCGSSLSPGTSCQIVVQFAPSTQGSFSGTINITYDNGISSSRSLTQAIVGQGVSNPPPIVIEAQCLRDAYAGESYVCTPVASGITDSGDSPFWALQNNTCGSWLGINSTTGVVSGVPGTGNAQVCDFEIIVSDGISGYSSPWRVHLDVIDNSGLSMLDSGKYHSCVIQDGKVKCWGDNSSGALGNNQTETAQPTSMNPVYVEDYGSPGVMITGATQVSAGSEFSCSRHIGGGVKCWGEGSNGELGNGSTSDKPGAVSVSGLSTNVSYVVAGVKNACALIADGQIKCWGLNANGIVGNDGVFSNVYSTPVSVKDSDGSNLTGAIQISMGETFACALMKDRKIKCWGDGAFGQLGQEQSGWYSGHAAEVLGFGPGLAQAVAISLGRESACAQLVDGQVKCWGGNVFGELGTGDTVSRGNNLGDMSSLVPVSLNGVTMSLASGNFYDNCAILNDHTLRCWGYNLYGQLGTGIDSSSLGDNEPVSSLSPVDLGDGAIPLEVSLGQSFTCARVLRYSSPDVLCWGKGDDSRYSLGRSDITNIGDGPYEMGNYLVPVLMSTWASLDMSSSFFDFLGGGLSVLRNSSSSGTVEGVSALINSEKSTGKWYFEVMIDAGLGMGDMRIGLVSSGTSVPSGGLGNDGPSSMTCGFDFSTQKFYFNGNSSGSTFPTLVQGDIVGFAIDLSSSAYEITVIKDGTSIVYSCALSGGKVMVVPALSMRYSGQQMTLNFGQNPFYNGVPAGFTPGWPEN